MNPWPWPNEFHISSKYEIWDKWILIIKCLEHSQLISYVISRISTVFLGQEYFLWIGIFFRSLLCFSLYFFISIVMLLLLLLINCLLDTSSLFVWPVCIFWSSFYLSFCDLLHRHRGQGCFLLSFVHLWRKLEKQSIVGNYKLLSLKK